MTSIAFFLAALAAVVSVQTPTDADLERITQATYDSIFSIVAREYPQVRASAIVADRREFARLARQHVDVGAFRLVEGPRLAGLGRYDYAALAACQLALKSGTCREPGLAYFHINRVTRRGPDAVYLAGMFEVPLGGPGAGNRLTHERSLMLYFSAQYVKRGTEWRPEFVKTSKGHM